MFRIDPHTLYTRQDLERELEGTMSVETFLEGLPLARPYKLAYWGAALIDAINELHRKRPAPQAVAGRPRIKPAAIRPVAKLDRIPMPTK